MVQTRTNERVSRGDVFLIALARSMQDQTLQHASFEKQSGSGCEVLSSRLKSLLANVFQKPGGGLHSGNAGLVEPGRSRKSSDTSYQL